MVGTVKCNVFSLVLRYSLKFQYFEYFRMVGTVKCTVVGAWVEGAVRNWFEEEEGGDGKR